MSKEFKSIMQGLKEAVDDAKGNNDLHRKIVEFSNTINSKEVPKDWDIHDDKERNKE